MFLVYNNSLNSLVAENVVNNPDKIPKAYKLEKNVLVSPVIMGTIIKFKVFLM